MVFLVGRVARRMKMIPKERLASPLRVGMTGSRIVKMVAQADLSPCCGSM